MECKFDFCSEICAQDSKTKDIWAYTPTASEKKFFPSKLDEDDSFKQGKTFEL